MIILRILITSLLRPSRLFIFGVLILAGFNLPGLILVRAQEVAGVKIQPAIIEQRVDAGQVVNFKLKITNISSEEKTFYLIKRDIQTLSPEGFPVFSMGGEATGFEISSWIKTTDKPIILGAGRTKEVPFSIVVPANATPGGHFGGLFAALTPGRPEKTGIAVGYQVGTLISLRVSGDVVEEAQIRSFFTGATVYSRPKIDLSAKIENLGNVLIRPHGILEIFDPFDREEAILNVNDEAAAVFPKTIREFTTSWESKKLLFGPYKATISLTYGEDGRKTLYDTTTFWLLPLNVILPIAGGIIVIVTGLFLFIRFQVKKKVRQIIKNVDEISVNRHRKSSSLLLAFALLTLFVMLLLLLLLLFLLFA